MASMSGLSTLGVVLGVGTWASNDTLANAYTAMGRINSIGGIELDQESIDASALVDTVTQYVEGRSDSGGTWPITVNVTPDTITEWEAIQGQIKWFEVYHPKMTKAFFVAATVPAKLPLPETAQNELWTIEINLVINVYYGLANAVQPTTPVTPGQ